jgi:hypothetical protein
MNILISGCSFTHWPEVPEGPNICWPAHLKELNSEYDITNLAEPAAGNQYICNSVIHHCETERPDLALVMWSGVSRLDYLTSLDDPAWAELFDSYGFYRRIPECNLGYIFSGGQMGTWFKHPVAHKMFYEMYKVSSNLSLAYINLIEIIKLQNYLEFKRIPYRFMSYVNYWQRNNVPEFNGDFSVSRIPELANLISAIDFSQWIFSDDQKNGVYELGLKHNDFLPDGIHPGATAHAEWAQTVEDAMRSVI